MIEVHKDYNGIDAENRRLFEKHGTNSNAMMYKCVICGTATCIDRSISDRGHNLICLGCVHDKNKFPNWYVDAFDWIHADTGRSREEVKGNGERLTMGQKYYIEAMLNGNCLTQQESKSCKTFIVFLITIIRFRLKYPIVNAKIRNGYKDCDKCNMGENKPLCHSSRKSK